ncbi:MAG: helix-turn-helix domain-containing protein [Clostridia bacterium]|nr:helix-turn-helix domain-containing protein [Clostridia bacterium]
MPRQPNPVILSEEQLIALSNLLESADPDLSKRAQVIIECSKGLNNKEISDTVGMNRINVAHWRNAFLEKGIDGLVSKHGGGASPRNPVEDFDAMLDKLLADKSIEWSAEALAQETGASLNMVYYA